MSTGMRFSTYLLRDAVNTGSVVWLKILLWIGVNVNGRYCRNQTSLHLACQSTDKHKQAIIELLLRYGAEVNVQNKNGRTPLHEAVEWSCRINKMNIATEADRSLDFEAIDKQIHSVTELLLRYGAEVNIQDNDGRTPLHEACIHHNETLVVALLNNGAKLSVVDIRGKPPLHEASLRPAASIGNTSLSTGHVDVSSENSTNHHSGYHPEDGEILNVLNHQDLYGYTALHYASSKNQVEVVRLLLRAGAKVGVKNKLGETALHCAAEKGSVDVIDVLLDNGEDVNAKDCSSNTPLHMISRSFYYSSTPGNTAKIIDNLLSRGAEIYAKNEYQETPYEDIIETVSDISNDDENLEDIQVPSFREMYDIEKIFIKHVIKLRALTNQVRFDIKWSEGGDNFYLNSLCCSYELERMESTLIVKDISVYDVLSHNENNSYILSTKDIQKVDKFLCSPDLLDDFPRYGHTLRVVFQRPKLLTLAVQSFYTEGRKQMMKELPCEVTEQLMTYLTNEDLRNFIRSE